VFPSHILDLARLRVGHSHRPLSCLVASALILGSLFAVAGPSEGQGSTCSGGRSLQGDPSNYRNLVNGLQPCDTLTLAAGTYTTELRITNLNGTASQHIVIKGPDTGPRPLFLGNPVSNVVEISNSSYVELKNIDINAQNLGGDGVNFKGLAHDVILDNLSLRGLSDDQGTVAISANHAPSWNITIRNCVITDAGTGMYLGNSDGNNQFLSGLIENNLIHDTIGYNIQIKQQNPLPTNIAGLPLTTTRTIIRDNVFSKANDASGGSLARPNLLVGHAPLSGPGQDNFFEIYGNFFYQNPVEALFQGEGNFALYDNLFFNSMNSGTPAIAIQAHQDRPRNVRVFNNTVVTVNTGISLTGGSPSYAQKVIGNAVFSPSPIQAADQFGNITDTYQNASNYLNNPFAALGGMDLFPKVGKLSGSGLDTSFFNTYTDYDEDFNGTVRTTASFRGAYFGEGQNPGWLPQIAIKPVRVNGGPQIAVTPGAISFDPVVLPGVQPMKVTVRNLGTADLILGSISMGGANPDQFKKPALKDVCSGQTLAPMETCTVVVRFKPTNGGPHSATLFIPSNDPVSNVVTVALDGTGDAPEITVDPTSYDFGPVIVGTQSQVTVTVGNDGVESLTLGLITIDAINPGQFRKPALKDFCSEQTLAPTQTCTMKIRFFPSEVGPQTAILVIPSDDFNENPVSVELVGTGTAP
jgi:hypothetical protein